MRWKDLKMSKKFMVGFGTVLGLLILVAGWAGTGIRNIVLDAEEVIDGNKLRGEMVQREVDHLKWAGALNALLTDKEIEHLTIETDHHQCGLGSWFYGEGRQNAEALIPQLAPILEKMEMPHKQLHASAIKIEDVFQPADLELPGFLAAKETDHLAWVAKVQDFLLDASRQNVGVELDDHQCGLGRFIYGPEGKKAAASDPRLAQLLEAIKAPHKELHESAQKIEAVGARRSEAQRVFNEQTRPALQETQEVLNLLQQRAKAMVSNLSRAKAIYSTETVPHLETVQGLLGEIVQTVNQNVMTDQKMIEGSRSTFSGVVALSVIALLAGIALATIIARGILRPLGVAVDTARRMAVGDLSMQIEAKSKDETGMLLKAMKDMVDANRKVAQSADRIAEGDLEVEIRPRSDEDSLLKALSRMVENLTEVIASVRQSADTVSSGSQAMSASSEELSQGATEQAASAEEASSS
ncbi:MAG: HAMP domain-containing protein, partial [Desulfuromonadales bacterium]|nr:HAMP domain-containing protein [Desulfuromonadales bacterium]